MRIAVVSDTHSRGTTVQAALLLIEPYNAELIIHCGDIEDPETVSLFPSNTHFVFGNCDFDRAGIQAAVSRAGATLHEPFGSLDLAGKKIAFLHGDDKRLLHDLQQADAFDFIFHGHTHQAAEHGSGRTRVINPGGLFRARPKTFAIVHLASGKIESVIVE
jgi:putative phosphoesterase